MNFLSPFAFLFALTIPVVIVFYLLKRKRVVKLVSSTLLWQKFLAETQASAPFQKLRRNWLLLLQILLLLLAVLALARPYFATKAKSSDLRVIILDASASMQSTDESPSRFEKARQEALKWVDSLREGDKMVILQVAANTEVKQSETSEKSALRRALLSCAALDSPTRLSPALKMAESLIRDRGKESNPEIHLFSDGAVPDLSDFDNKALPLIYHKVGKGANNLGLTALDVKANPEDASQRAIYVSVANVSTNEQSTDLELRLDGKLLETRPVKIPPGEVSPQLFLASQSSDGVFTVQSTLQDDLAADNAASIVSQARQRGWTGAILGGNGFNSPAFIKNAGTAAEGVMVGTSWNSLSQDPANQKFLASMKKAGVNPDQFSAQAYTGVIILAEAIQRSGGKTGREDIVAGLGKVKDLDTPLGKFSFTPNRDAQHEPSVQQVKDGKFQIVQ